MDQKIKATDQNLKTATGLLIATAAFAVYLVFAFQLWGEAGTRNAEKYARLIAIWGGIEAIAFAAVGWLFGKQVSRQAIEIGTEAIQRAEARAQVADERAELALADAVAMASAVTGETTLEGTLTTPNKTAELAQEILQRYRGG